MWASSSTKTGMSTTTSSSTMTNSSRHAAVAQKEAAELQQISNLFKRVRKEMKTNPIRLSSDTVEEDSSDEEQKGDDEPPFSFARRPIIPRAGGRQEFPNVSTRNFGPFPSLQSVSNNPATFTTTTFPPLTNSNSNAQPAHGRIRVRPRSRTF